MTSPLQNILAGVHAQAEARLVAEQEAKAIAEAEATEKAGTEAPEAIEEMSPQQMSEAINLLAKAVMDLKNKDNGGA